MMSGGIGFVRPLLTERPHVEHKAERTATEAAKRTFAPEFMNRVDKVVVFRPLRTDQLEQILEIELDNGAAAGTSNGKGKLLLLTNAERADVSIG